MSLLQFPTGRDDSSSSGAKEGPPITIRRCPAEYYIRYRILAEPGVDAVTLGTQLERELVFAPATDYIPRLRDEMQIPKVFRPNDLSHLASQQLLRRYGVWSYFHQSRGTKEALRVFSSARARQRLEAYLCSPNPWETVLDLMRLREDMPMSRAGLEEFRHYFWNMGLLRLEELYAYVKKYLHDHTLLAQIYLPKTEAHSMLSLAKLGVVPDSINEEQALRTFQLLFYQEALEASTRPNTMGRTAAMRMASEGFQAASTRLQEVTTGNSDLANEVEQFRAETRARENPTLQQLLDGHAPLPVGLLVAEEEVEVK